MIQFDRRKQFLSDDEFGQIAEEDTIRTINAEGTYSVVKPSIPVSGYDLIIKNKISEEELKIEVKFDRQTKRTGNVAVEVSKEINGVKKESGLSITKADFYVYKILGEDKLYFIKTSKLKSLIEEIKAPVIPSGDNEESRCALVRKNIFANACDGIIKISK